MGGKIPATYADLVHRMWNGSGSSFAPRQFKDLIGERNQTFEGYGQQDSHELLSTLLDGLHEDLNRVKKKEYCEDPEMNQSSESEFAEICWKQYLKRNNSIIVDLFQAQLKSKTECINCGHISIKFDPYMYLQLPVPEPTTVTVKLHVFCNESQIHLQNSQYLNENPFAHARPRLIALEVPRNCSIATIKLLVAKRMRWKNQSNPDMMVMLEIFNSKVHRIMKNSDSVNDFSSRDHMAVYEVEKYGDLFNTSGFQFDAESFHLPAFHSFDSSSFHSTTDFGIPSIVSVPSIYSVKDSKKRTLQLFGELCYELLIISITKYSKIPLFRKIGSNVSASVVIESVKNSTNLPFNEDDLSFNKIQGFEPIPDLFQVSLSDNSIYRTKYTEIYPLAVVSEKMKIENANISSPKSDLSELSHKLQGKSLNEYDLESKLNYMNPSDQFSNSELSIHDSTSETHHFATINDSFDGSKTPIDSFQIEFNKDSHLNIVWRKEVAEFIFGSESIPVSTYSSTPNSVFEVLVF
jgi:hypothetical protein